MTEDKDILVHYVVGKAQDTKVDTRALVALILDYVQNKEMYFSFIPQFIHDVLVFGVVSSPDEQKALQNELGESIVKIGCLLEIVSVGKPSGEIDDKGNMC